MHLKHYINTYAIIYYLISYLLTTYNSIKKIIVILVRSDLSEKSEVSVFF